MYNRRKRVEQTGLYFKRSSLFAFCQRSKKEHGFPVSPPAPDDRYRNPNNIVANSSRGTVQQSCVPRSIPSCNELGKSL